MTIKISDIRKEYSQKELNLEQVDKNPIIQFRIWFQEAILAEVPEPNAMIFSTVSKSGIPSARVLLLKGIEDYGFTFYTNYKSNKGVDIQSNPNVAATFFWPQLERQIRIQGRIEKTSESISDEYFRSRPRGSQLGAWSSPQSKEILNRKILEEKLLSVEKEFEGKDIPRPPHWGGYIIYPSSIEFWQGRPSRLHDRILFSNFNNGSWEIKRLAP